MGWASNLKRHTNLTVMLRAAVRPSVPCRGLNACTENAMAGTKLGPIILVVRNVAVSKAFYAGLGLRAAAQLEETLVAFGEQRCACVSLLLLRCLRPATQTPGHKCLCC